MGTGDTPPESEQLIGELSEMTARFTVEFLGRCVIAWSTAERSLETLLVILLSGRRLRMEDARIVVSNLDIRERAKLVVALAYQAKLPHKRLTKIERLAGQIQNDLRNRRNRLFHDSWNLSESGIFKRASTGTKLVRSQAFKIGLFVPDFEPIKPAMMYDFINDCMNLAGELADQCQKLVDDMERELPPETPPKSDAQSPRPPKVWTRVLQRFGLASRPPPRS
jgi:hypothetical protein